MESPWILALCHEFPPLGGGAGKNLYLLCRELTRRGISVRVWTVDPGARNRWKHDFQVEYIPTSRTERFETNLKGMAAFIAGACKLGWRNRKARPALILANLGIPAGVAGWFLGLLLKAPLAVWHHGSDVHAGQSRGPGGLQRFLLQRIWSRSEMNFFVSSGLKDMACTLGRPRMPRILPACPSPEILAIEARVDMKAGQADDAGRGTGYFLFLGRFDPVKNPLLILQALQILKAEGGVTRKLRMVGSGALADEVHNTIRHNALAHFVALEGAAAFEKVPDLLRSAYALVVPSRIEGFNTTILEAAHFGVPAVASDAQGIRDFVIDGETGLLFSENDAAGLAAALRKLSADPELRNALGRKAKRAAAPFRPDSVAQSFLCGIGAVAPAMGVHAEAEAASWN